MRDGFVSNIIKFYIPSIVTFILGLLSAVILTRVFEPAKHGILSIFNNAVTVGLSISYLGFDSAFIRFYNELPAGYSAKQLGFSLMRLSLIILLVWSGFVGIFLFDAFSEWVFGEVNIVFCLSMLANILAQLILRYYSITYRMTFSTKKYAIVTILIQVATRFFVIIAALFTTEINNIIVTNSIGIVIMALFMLIKFHSDIIPVQRKWGILKETSIIKYALYAAPIPIIINLNTFISQKIIANHLGYAEQGIYSTATYFTTAFVVLQSGFATFWSAYVYANYKSDDLMIKKMNDYISLALIFVLGCFILFRDTIYLLIGKGYHGSKEYFALSVFYPAMTLLAETTGYGIQIKKKTQYLLVIYIITMLINVVLAFSLVDRMGGKGMALSVAVSGLIFYLIVTFLGQKYYRTIKKIGKSVGGLIIICAMVTVSAFVAREQMFVLEIMLIMVGFYLYRIECQQLCKLLGDKTKDIWKSHE